MIMGIPLVLVYKVQITFQQKAGLVGVFSLAFVTIAIAIVRCFQAINNQRELVFLSVWSTVESAICKSMCP
jgi:rhodopsin domain-containing protein